MKEHFPCGISCLQSVHPPHLLSLPPSASTSPCSLSSRLSARLALNAFSQSRPNITSHLLIVTSIYFSESFFSPFIKKMTLSQRSLNPSTIQLCFGQPLPETPYQILCSTSVILSILDCLTLSQLPKYLALLYLIPKEPINLEYPTFSWIHSLLFSNTTSMF